MRVLRSSLYLGDPELGDLLNTIGHYSFASGTIAMTLFTLFVFRREKPAARLFAALSLTFFPPAAYTRRIRARGARPEPS